MDLYPAIDLRGGRAVRLMRGDYAAETVYGEDPVAVAKGFEAAGVGWIHVVDLEAARSGEAANRHLVGDIARSVHCRVQAGGGVRDRGAAELLFAEGAARVVVGTAAVTDPAFVTTLCAEHPGRVAAGLDARSGRLAVRGWTEDTDVDLVEAARRLEGAGVAALVVTEIGRDGTMEGPDVDQLRAVLDATRIDVIASGGVGTLDDLLTLRHLRAGDRRLAGAIVGRAIYEGRFTVEEGFACLAPG